MTRVLIILLFALTFSSIAQNVTIKGIAGAAKGHEIAIYLYDDLITYSQTKVNADTVDSRGNFELKLDIKVPQVALIRTNKLVGKLYLQPNFMYGIIFPPADSARFIAGGTEQSVDITVNGDSTELNARIIDFNSRFDEFWQKHYKSFVTKHIHRDLDSFQLQINKRYEKVRLTYFKTYVEYSFALMNENTGRHRSFLAQRYLFNKPIDYNNFEYMEFFNQYFKQYLQKLTASKNGTLMLDAINVQGEYPHLEQLVKSDPVLTNDTLRELVLIKGLYELYYAPHFDRVKIRNMFAQLQGITKIPQHKTIVSHILRNINNLLAGSKAPDFTLINSKRDTIHLSDYANRYVYLGFFAPWCTDCLEQFKKQEQLFKKFGDKIYFISVDIDDDTTAFKNFIKQNPKYAWTFLRMGKQKDVVTQYNAASVPIYYLVNMQGNFIQSPAMKPDEGIERKFNELLKIKPKKPR
jgi:thiol-disulfide isomerase/thioredoxin